MKNVTINTTATTSRAKDSSRSAFTTAGFAEFQIKKILGGPGPGAAADHLLALLCSIDVDFDLNGKLLKNKLLNSRTTGASKPRRETVERRVKRLLNGRDAKASASGLRSLLCDINDKPEALDDALDFVTSQISLSARKKPRLRH